MAPSTIVMKAFAFVLLLVPVTAGCHGREKLAKLDGITSESLINVDGTQRMFLIQMPRDFSKTNNPAGIIFSYHDEGRDAYHQKRISNFENNPVASKFILVFPNATDGTWYPGRTNAQDVDFTYALLKRVSSTAGVCLDPDRIYATGMGSGSGFVHHLNCYNNRRPHFSAFAGVAGIPQTLDMTDEEDQCSLRHSKPLLMIHGTKDFQFTQLTDSRGQSVPDINEWSLALAWATAMGLKTKQMVSAFPSSDSGIDRMVYRRQYHDNTTEEKYMAKSLVELHDFRGVGHAWESQEAGEGNGNTANTADATKIIMDFFEAHARSPSAAYALRPATFVMTLALAVYFCAL